MGCSIKEISDYLQKEFQLDLFLHDVFPPGIQVEGRNEVRKIGVAVSSSLTAISKAEREGVDFFLVHHGMVFKNRHQAIKGIFKKKVELLFEGGITLYALHLPLDGDVKWGNNFAATRDLQWESLEPFYVDPKQPPIGVKGSFDPIDVEVLQKKLESYYDHKAVVALKGKKEVSSAVLLSGGGHKFIEQAAAVGVDLFITGSFDEPTWHSAEELGINFMAFGHAATEKVGVQKLGMHLSQKFDLDYIFIDEKNPF